METERNELQATELLAKITKQKRTLMIWGAISLSLLAFVVIGFALIVIWTGEVPWGDLTPFVLLLAFDIPLLIVTAKGYKSYNILKKEEKSLVKESSPSGDYARNRQLLEKERELKLSLLYVPIIAVISVVMQYSMVIMALIVVLLVINLIRYKKIRTKIQESGITEKERADFAEESKKNNKTKGTILAIFLVIILIVASSVGGGGGSKSQSGDKPWKELGVSEREYWEIYNIIKFGK